METSSRSSSLSAAAERDFNDARAFPVDSGTLTPRLVERLPVILVYRQRSRFFINDHEPHQTGGTQ
jgi:hypothetical protein